jgi:hypothetical protein
MKPASLPGIALFLAAWLTAGSALAIGEAEKNGYSIEAIGAGRLTGAYMHFPDVEGVFPEDDDALGAGVFRLILEGDLKEVAYELNFYTDLSRVPTAVTGGTFDTVSSFDTPYRTRYLSWNYWQDGTINGQLGLDSISVHYLKDPVAITVGRFPINYAVTNIFTPNDFFVPFSASAINKIYKPGVDALRLGIATGTLSAVEFVGVMGYGDDDVPAWGQSAVLVRANTVLWNFEWALIGGKVAERWVVGASLQGEAGPIGIRAEGHAGFPDEDADGLLNDVDGNGDELDDIHGRFSFGLDVPFTWHNANIAAEYAFYSDGTGDPDRYIERAQNFYPDDQPYMGRHYVGLNVGMDIVPILRANLLGLLNAEDYSGMASFMLVYSIADEADFVGGLLIPWGERPESPAPPATVPALNSEFGLMALTVFLESRFYF